MQYHEDTRFSAKTHAILVVCACLADAQHTLDAVSVLGYTIYENDAADESVITPLTLGDESCTSEPVPPPTPVPTQTTIPPTPVPTQTPMPPTPPPTQRRPTPAPIAPEDTPSPTAAFTLPAAWQDCNFDGAPTRWLGDGYCDPGLNNEDCGYDGGASGYFHLAPLPVP